MPLNQLAHEKSPYLLQHAHNPVHWYPWGGEAFARSRSENKPIFLSIGYSTCHWCHVMERESFESDAIADLLNRHFVSIKVDREERPDVDRIYMTFVQATTGSGGWPMSVFLTPDLKPFFGGTYFPPDDRYGRPGFGAVLQHIAEVWGTEAGKSKVLESGAGILEELRSQTAGAPASSAALDRDILDKAFFAFRRMYDSRYGGFGQAPKFPRPAVFHFLLRYGHSTGNEEAFEMTFKTLRAMAEGGMNDQLGGGFHRYSVDERWFVSHFEKMLYDQAQLANSYLEAFQLTGDRFFADVARSILEYVLRDMSHPEGGFYSAEDADSVVDPARPEEKGEGAFYIWSWREIAEAVGADSAALFAFHYGVEREGNVAEDPHGEFTQRNILAVRKTAEETAAKFGKSVEAVNEELREARAKLLELRSRRIRPHLDDKILTAWNALMISAFAKGAQALDEPRYGEAAQRAADFILDRVYQQKTGILLRRYRDGEAAIEGFLDDYAFFLQALIDLYEADFRPGRLAIARRIADQMLALFGDAQGGGFFSTAEGDPSLVLRIKEEYDGAEPAGNSVAGLALVRLSELTGEERYRTEAERTFRAMGPRVAAQPAVAPYLLSAVLFSLGAPQHVIIAGRAEDPATAELLRRYRAKFLPGSLVLLIDSEEAREALASGLPFVRDMRERDGRPAAYVCQNYACQLPVNDPDQLSGLLK